MCRNNIGSAIEFGALVVLVYFFLIKQSGTKNGLIIVKKHPISKEPLKARKPVVKTMHPLSLLANEAKQSTEMFTSLLQG